MTQVESDSLKQSKNKLSLGFRLVGLLVTSFVTLYFAGCYAQTPPNVNYTYVGYGSNTFWNWLMNGNTGFMGTEGTTYSLIAGVAQRYMGGFARLASLTVGGSQGPTNPNTQIVKPAIEFQGAAFFVYPTLNTETEIIAAVQAGNCPTGDMNLNYAYLQFSTNDLINANRDYGGTFVWSQANSTITLSQSVSLPVQGNGNGYGAPAGSTTLSGTCTNGEVTFANGTAYLTNANIAILKFTSGPNAGDLLVAMPQTAIVSRANLIGSYEGFFYDGNPALTTGQTQILQGQVRNWDGMDYYSVNANDYNGADNVLVNQSLVFNGYDKPSAGLMQVGSTLGSANYVCAFATNVFFSAQTLIVCSGPSPTDKTKPASFVWQSHI
jgi:hypothetical protein